MKIRVEFEIEEDHLDALIRGAPSAGYKRLNPRKSWSTKEKVQCFRWSIQAVVRNTINLWKETNDEL